MENRLPSLVRTSEVCDNGGLLTGSVTSGNLVLLCGPTKVVQGRNCMPLRQYFRILVHIVGSLSLYFTVRSVLLSKME